MASDSRKSSPVVEKTNPGRLRRLLFNNTLIVMGATLASRVLGLLREAVVAAKFGTSDDYSAYYAAFKIPDALYLLIIGGALGSALIPVFSGFLGKGEAEKAWRLANSVINISFVVLLVAALLAFIFAPQLVSLVIAPNFPPPAKELTANLARMLLIQPLLLGLGGIFMALLNGSEHFLIPALAPIFYNLCIIGGALLLGDRLGVFGLAWGVVTGAAIYLTIQIPALVRMGWRYQPRFDRNAPGSREVLKALGPRLVGQAAFQINFIVITNLASAQPKTLSAIGYAFQILMLPHGLFAMSVAVVSFPAMSRQFGAGDIAGLKLTLVKGMRQIFFFALPASLGLGLLARPIVRSLLEFGTFSEQSTDLVSYALIFFSLGLVAYGIVEIITRAFYAMQDTATPVTIAVLTIGINIGLSLLLLQPLGHGGLALSLAITNTLEMILLLWLISRKLGKLDPDGGQLWLGAFKIALAADFMGCFLLGVNFFLSEPLAKLSKFPLIILTLLIVAIAGAIYAATAWLLKVEELNTVARRFLRRRA